MQAASDGGGGTMGIRSVFLRAAVAGLAATVLGAGVDAGAQTAPAYSPPRPDWRPAPDYGVGARRSVVVGDSLTVDAADEYQALTSGVLRSSVNAAPGVDLRWWGPAIGFAAQERPTAIVLALGGNDANVFGVDPLILWDQGLRGLTAAGQCTAVVTFRPTTARQQDFARRQRALLAKYPQVKVFDWAAFANEHAWIHQPDGAHHSAQGQQAYAWALFLAQLLCP